MIDIVKLPSIAMAIKVVPAKQFLQMVHSAQFSDFVPFSGLATRLVCFVYGFMSQWSTCRWHLRRFFSLLKDAERAVVVVGWVATRALLAWLKEGE